MEDAHGQRRRPEVTQAAIRAALEESGGDLRSVGERFGIGTPELLLVLAYEVSVTATDRESLESVAGIFDAIDHALDRRSDGRRSDGRPSDGGDRATGAPDGATSVRAAREPGYYLPASSSTAACASLRAGSVEPTEVARY